jgi:integrative and conjugative element protein (TIGR02256 family)
MCTEVYKHQHIETGGNLFGLWTTSGSAVIHVVLGPGQGCKRTNTSFHQDLEYMARVGRFVNEGYMLCHIGEWHSHHNLSLSKPSAGDESTIRRNFPRGMSKFLVIIANIRNGDTIKLSPYFFTDGGECYEIAEYVVLDSDGPFSTDDKIVEEIHLRAEGKEYQRRRETTLVEVANHSGASLRNTGNRQNTSSNSQRDGNTDPTRLQANKCASLVGLSTSASKPSPSSSDSLVNLRTSTSKPNPSSSDSLVNSNIPASKANTSVRRVDSCTPNPKANQSTPNSQVDQNTSDSKVNQSSSESQATPNGSTREEPMDTEDSDLHPPGDHERSSDRPENGTSASQPSTSASGQADPDKNKNGNEETLSEHDIALKKIHDQLKKWFGIQSDSKFKFEKSKDIPGANEISFKHNRRYWMVRFPEDFPTNPAKLFYSTWEASVRSNECFGSEIVKPLNNEVHVLLTIKNVCSVCKVCKNFTKESLSQPDLNSRSMEKLAVSLNKLVSELTTIFSDVTALNVNHPLDTSHAKIAFKHGHYHWIINLPAQFPEIPAKVSYLFHEKSSQEHDALLYEKYSYGPQDLNTSKLIIKAIHSNCPCRRCSDIRQQYR